MVTSNMHCLSLLILTEDSASDSHETITAVVKKMLQIIVQNTQTHRIEFEPQNNKAAIAMHGNRWKSRQPRDHQKLVDLYRIIATKLVEGNSDHPGFVLFHFDGDCSWANRFSSENSNRFAEFTNRYIRPLVEGALTKKGISHELEGRMKRLYAITPFYSIEAWLYQNTSEALRICDNNCGRHKDQIRSWEADRGSLDEVVSPKSKNLLLSWFGKQFQPRTKIVSCQRSV